MQKLILLCTCLLLVNHCQAEIINVDDDGPADFDTIQATMDDFNTIDGSERSQVDKKTINYIRKADQNEAMKAPSTQVPPAESGSVPDSLSRQVAEIFKKVDELQERKKQRSTEYLSSLSDEKLAEIYTKHTRNEDPLFALESVKKDRPRVARILLRQVVITPEDKKAFAAEFDKITEELTSLGPAAVPETIVYLRRPKSGPRRWVPNIRQRLLLWENALFRMGSGIVEPLIALMDDESIFLREKVAFVLSRQADPRAKDVLLRGLDDKSRSVRISAMDGLVRLGPEVVGQDKLAAIWFLASKTVPSTHRSED